jgi:hypothetical protein
LRLNLSLNIIKIADIGSQKFSLGVKDARAVAKISGSGANAGEKTVAVEVVVAVPHRLVDEQIDAVGKAIARWLSQPVTQQVFSIKLSSPPEARGC